MAAFPRIEAYRAELAAVIERGGSRNELSVRGSFGSLLRAYCARDDLTLVDELRNKRNRPDGTVKTAFRLDHGYWEAKDEKDDLDREMEKKFRRDYPRFNILFENTKTAVLFQNDAEAMRVNMEDDAQLDAILRAFVGYQRPEIANFRAALDQFKADLPDILKVLRAAIGKAQADNKKFAAAAREFLALCRETINPNVGRDDIREMLIQHILTADIFRRIFDEEQFHSENNIAKKLDALANTFFAGDFRRNIVDKLKSYYAAIVRAAADLTDNREKQKFLKAVYEKFYSVYNPAAADRLGVVYTPSEVVNFMVRSADQLVHKHFGKRLWDDRVQILDPATGTGTFVAELIDYFPAENLRDKYAKELHANEVAILPYYIANLNIEHAYKAKIGEYREFPGICFVDTLDNLAFKGGTGKSQRNLGGIATENMARILRQNDCKISVVIGNPPWNANQMNENQNNKNRAYRDLDKQIKSTYFAESTAQKHKLYDMYVRFIRWASDRIGENGVVAFVTNSSFIDAKGFDGFRKVVAQDFNELHILDLRGNSRLSPEEMAQQGGNIFNVRVGVAVWFFVRNAESKGCQIWHYAAPDGMSATDKLALLFPKKNLNNFNFRSIVPDSRNNWVGQSDNDFSELIPLADKDTKLVKRPEDERAIFKLFSLGFVTNRDDWAYAFDSGNLRRKVRHFCKFYAAERERYIGDFSATGGETVSVTDWVNREIKWTAELEAHLQRGTPLEFSGKNIRETIYRPFVPKRTYYADVFTHRKYKTAEMFPTGKAGENVVICFSTGTTVFSVLATNHTPGLDYLMRTQCVPLYRYAADGKKLCNVTGWGLSRFREHYGDKTIGAEDVFHYAYGVLHSPDYRAKYGVNLRREFPRLPFCADFRKWAKRGAKLMALHLDFESEKLFPLVRQDSDGNAGQAKLQADREGGRIVVDEKTTLEGIPAEAWEYKLGSRSALEWVLDQHKEKRVKDPTVAAKFPPSPFSGRKEAVIELLLRVCTVSVETMKIIREMEKEND